jgi:hypothetical protein
MKDQLRAHLLKTIAANDGEPVPQSVLRESVRRAFPNVAHTEADLTLHLQHCEERGWITGTYVELIGTVWALTPKGLIKRAQLG